VTMCSVVACSYHNTVCGPWCYVVLWYVLTTTLHSITAQKTATWIFTAVKTSNLASERNHFLDLEAMEHTCSLRLLDCVYYIHNMLYVRELKILHIIFIDAHILPLAPLYLMVCKWY
jgi:hypothetical protein